MKKDDVETVLRKVFVDRIAAAINFADSQNMGQNDIAHVLIGFALNEMAQFVNMSNEDIDFKPNFSDINKASISLMAFLYNGMSEEGSEGFKSLLEVGDRLNDFAESEGIKTKAH